MFVCMPTGISESYRITAGLSLFLLLSGTIFTNQEPVRKWREGDDDYIRKIATAEKDNNQSC
jgi:hypothetical protein